MLRLVTRFMKRCKMLIAELQFWQKYLAQSKEIQ